MSKLFAAVAIVMFLGAGAFGVSKVKGFASRINGELSGISQERAPAQGSTDTSRKNLHGLQPYQEATLPKSQAAAISFVTQSTASQQDDAAQDQKAKRKSYKKSASPDLGGFSPLLKVLKHLSPSKFLGNTQFKM